MDRVLDTAALLHWPLERLSGGICASSQRRELESVSETRSLLLEAANLDWRDAPPSWLDRAKQVASTSGDLPRLSDVDLDVLALAVGLSAVLVTDDYKLQNTFKAHGGVVESVNTKGASQVWHWELRCLGCRATFPVPKDAQRSKKGAVGECERCGSPTEMKRSKRRS
ncbi:MAG: hypothetical protein L7S56_04505 [Candidatus Poseidonia sp.]|nr:hypothetical protein [Poseidonia sp.]